MRLIANVARLAGCAGVLLFGLASRDATAAAGDGRTLWEPLASTPALSASRAPGERWLGLDEDGLRALLAHAPPVPGDAAAIVVALPLASGEFREFRITQSVTMAPELAARYPQIRTYQGAAADGSAARVRLETGPLGLSVMTFEPGRVQLIERDRISGAYVSFDRGRRASPRTFACGVHDDGTADLEGLAERAFAPAASGPALRTYRTAIAATGEYTAFFGGTLAQGLNAVVTATNRINQIFETDLAIRLVLVPGSDQIVYTNGAADPYTNNDGGAMLDENQSNLDGQIGSANYDFGHVFSTGGGGVAFLGSICDNGSKAGGVTGSGAPTNDPFWVDYVAHEMGHQLDGPHTFNGTTSSCGGGNRSGTNAYEPGSGSSIMAYAGICGAENLQPNSDAFFHVSSLARIHAYTQTGDGATCGTSTATGNTTPVVAVTPNATIPARTPFRLTASATDADGDALTYSWEEFDLGTAAPPNSDNGTRPIFRTFDPTASPVRLFPRLADIVSGTATLGESLPTTNRTLRFRVVVRDNALGGGGVQFSGGGGPAPAQVQLTVVDTGTGFAITSQNTATAWAAGSNQTVTWDVAGTTANGINCANVDIAFSTDRGQAFPITLASATANDGSEGIVAPAQAGTSGRIRVACSNNIFFDINNADITVTGGNAAPVVTLSGGSATYTTGTPAIVIDGAATVADADSANFDGGALRATLTVNGEFNDRLDVRNEGSGAGQIGVAGTAVTFSGATIGTLSGGIGIAPLVVALNASATPAAVQALARNLTFRNASGVAGTLARTFALAVEDGDGAASAPATRAISVAINASPTVVEIDDGDADDSSGPGIALNYTVRINRAVDLASVSAADFDNAGSASIAIGTIAQPSPGVLTLPVTPSGNGTVILRVPAGATISTTGGGTLVTPFSDDTVVSIDSIAPTVQDIDDGDADDAVNAGDVIAYMVLFSEDIDLTSVTAADFQNAGTSPVSFGTITEPVPGTLRVPVTPTAVGTVILRVLSANVIKDAAGNALAAPALDDTTITVSPLAPATVTSFTEPDADNIVGGAQAVAYTVTFSRDVDFATVGAADFDNAGTSAVTIGTITEPSPGTLNVPVTPTTSGTLILRIPAGATINDVFGTAVTVPAQDDDTLAVDATAPTVTSIDEPDADNLVAANVAVAYTITFSEDIAGATLGVSDFVNAGTAPVTFGTPTETSPGVATLAVTPTAAGTLRLRIPVGAQITDVVGNALALPVTDDVQLIVDALAPTVTGFEDGDPDNLIGVGRTLTYVVTFSEDIDGPGATGAGFNNAGTAAITIGSVSETSTGVLSVPVTATGGGTLILRLASASVRDVAGNAALVPAQDADTVTVDAAAPTVVSSTRVDPNPTRGPQVNFLVTFSEAVTGADAADFAVTTTGALSGATVVGVTGSGATRTVTVALGQPGTGPGTLRLDVIDNDSVLDAAGLALGGAGTGNGAFTGGEAYDALSRADALFDDGFEDGTLQRKDLTEVKSVSGTPAAPIGVPVDGRLALGLALLFLLATGAWNLRTAAVRRPSPRRR